MEQCWLPQLTQSRKLSINLPRFVSMVIQNLIKSTILNHLFFSKDKNLLVSLIFALLFKSKPVYNLLPPNTSVCLPLRTGILSCMTQLQGWGCGSEVEVTVRM